MTQATLVLAYTTEDAALAARLEKDLQVQGYTIQAKLTPKTRDILIALISSASSTAPALEAVMFEALDNGQHIIPVQVTEAPLPKLINHLQAVNFSGAYALDALLERIAAVSAPGAPMPLKVLTPSVRRANRSVGYWLTILAVVWFIIGIVLVGFYGIQAPTEEYNNIDTEVAATIDSYLRESMPRSTEDAVNFPVTVQAAPTSQRPLLVETATALVAPTKTK